MQAKVEHPLRVIKQQFGYAKVRYRGLEKNTARLTMLLALGNLWMARERRDRCSCKVPEWHWRVLKKNIRAAPKKKHKRSTAARLWVEVAGLMAQLPATFMRFTRMEPTVLAP